MNRVRTFLYEGALIVFSGVAIALLVMGALHFTHRPTIEDFKREYKSGTLQQQVAVADTYLQFFSVQQLNAAVEAQNAAGVCHTQAHALGRAVYKKYPNLAEAAAQCGNSCSYGCFHGTIMQMFNTDSDTLGGVVEDQTPQEYIDHVKSIAASLCTQPEVEGVVRPRFCYHALGHVFAFMYDRDYKKSMVACDFFTNIHAATSCRNGVIMEYLYNKSSLPLLYTKDDKPCDIFPQYTTLCYRFKAFGWLTVWGGIAPALKACDAFGENKMLCIRNLAEAYASAKMLSSDAGIESICGSVQGDDRAMCITGAMRKILTLNDGDDTEHACDPVAASYRAQCLRVREEFRNEIYYED